MEKYIYSFCGKGVREKNEDFIGVNKIGENNSLYIVADGLGGYGHGDIAAQLIAESINQYISLYSNHNDVHTLLKNAIEFANEQIFCKREEYESKLGATFGGIYFCDNCIYGFWIGDVRIYQFRNKEIVFQSEDHSLINQLKKRSIVSIKDINRYKHIVTQSLSGRPIIELPIIELASLKDDIFFICSDGLWNNVSVEQLLSFDNDSLNLFLSENVTLFNDNYSIIKIQLH